MDEPMVWHLTHARWFRFTMPLHRFEFAKPGGCGLIAAGPNEPLRLWHSRQVCSVWQLAHARMLRCACRAW